MLINKQKEIYKRFRARHLKRMRAKDKKRYKENRASELARNKAYYPKYYKKNGDAIRLRRRCYAHGCTPEWLEQQKKKQKNRCAICRNTFVKTPHVDHDHTCCQDININNRKTCGKCNRGLLCDDCNLGIGRFKDNPKLLQAAIEYLKAFVRTGNGTI